MRKRQPLSPALLALTASALSIPGIARAADTTSDAPPPDSVQSGAARPDNGIQADYRFSYYREDDLPGSKTAGASGKRYDVDSHQFRVSAPYGDANTLAANLTYETMSGASPWFITPGPGNKPVQVMSGASIHDRRAAIELEGTHDFTGYSGTLHLGYSDERDYRDLNIGVEGSYDLDADKINTLTGGLGYSDDTVEPTDGHSTKFPTRITHATRNAKTAFIGIAHVFDADTVAQTSVSYSVQDGFLSDPYKLAFVNGTTVQDSRPDGRKLFSWLTRLRHFFPGVNGALHADYRYFEDDWDVVAHTLDLSWYQNFPQGWTVTPDVRWYSQSQSFFYAPFFNTTRSDNLYTSDYRLSPYGAISLSLEAVKQFETWNVSLRYEHYDSDGSYAVSKVKLENPGLVDFDIISLGLRKTF